METGYGEMLHGQAVAIGMVVELRYGERMGRASPEVVARGIATIGSVGLPTVGPVFEREAVWEVTSRDEKASQDGVRAVLLDELGHPVLDRPDRRVVDEVLDEAWPR